MKVRVPGQSSNYIEKKGGDSLIILLIYYVNIWQVYLCLYSQVLLIFANEGCHNSLWLIDTVFDKSGNAIIHV